MKMFELLHNEHVQNNVTYKKGNIVETELDLDKMFKNKFKRRFELEAKVDPPEKPSIPAKSDISSPPPKTGVTSGPDPTVAPVEAVPLELGTDVTLSFLVKGTGLKVFKYEDKFVVVDAEGKQTAPMTRVEADVYLKMKIDA